MAKITYTDKEAINIDTSIPDKNKCMSNDLNEIKNVVNINENKTLVAVSSTAPSQCTTGDLYYNTTSKKIFTATATDTWSSTGEDPTENTLYLCDNTIYFYDGTTLVGINSSGAGGESLPVGSIIAFAGDNAPEGYLLCKGQILLRSEYPELYSVVGTHYGITSGDLTFRIPNISGRVLVGLDSTQTEFNALGKVGGSKYLQEHNHTGISLSGSPMVAFNSGSSAGYKMDTNYSTSINTTTNNFSTGYTGTGNSGNLQPYIVVNYIIKAHPSVVNTSEVVNEHSTSETDVYSANYVNNNFQSVGEELYSNLSGTNDNVSLSKNISNYSYIEIYGNKASCYGFTKVPAIAGLSFGLAIHNTYDTRVIQQIFGKYHFNSNGLQIVKEREVYMNDNGSPDVSNDIYITRVIGYK